MEPRWGWDPKVGFDFVSCSQKQVNAVRDQCLASTRALNIFCILPQAPVKA